MRAIFYHFSIYKKVIIFLTIFTGCVIIIMAVLDIYSLRKIKYGEYNDRLNAGKRSFEASLDRLSNRVRTIASNRSTRHPLVTALKNNESIDLLLQKSSSPRQLGTGAMMIVAGKDSIMAFSSEQYEPDIFESLKQYIIKTDTAYSGLGILHSKNNNFVGVIGVAPIHVITDREMYFLQIIQIGNGFCDEFKETTGVNSTIWIQEQRYATSDIDKDGNRILDVVTGADIIKKVLGLGKTVTVHTDLLSKRDFALISPLKDLSGGRVGMFGVGINANELASEQRRLIFENILIEFIIFVIVILISIIISKKLTTPLVEFHKMATSISVGNYNLPEFAITGKDELNSLKKSFNRMLYEIREREARELEFKRNQALRLSELTVLNDIATEINVNQDLDAILKLILKKTITVVNTPYGLIILFDRDSAIIKYIGLGFPQDVKLESLCETVISRLKQERKVIFLKLDSDSGLDGYFTELKLSQALCIPFLKKDYVSGALCFFLTDEHESLSDEQLRVLNIVAENSVRVIENARLYQSEREKELLKQEMELARNVQQNLLSEGDMQISAFEITSHNTPSLEVSGDYYDVIKLDDNRVMVSIADVSGKGMSAALLMANLQAAVRSLIHEHYSIDELVNKMNNLIFESTESSAYITFFISIINTTNGEMEYVNAGHNPPLIFRHDGENNNIEYLKTGGLLLGWLKNIQYSKGTAKIEIDDILLLYTDGLTEAMNLNEEEFGEERLISEILLHRTLSGGEIKTTVLSSVAQFTRGEMQSDDITMVIVKRNK